MAEISAALVKQLRDKTGAGMMECKKALTEANGDLNEAEVILRKRGIASASKKAERATKAGVIGNYVDPNGQLGVLVEVNCESDFVARTDDFQNLVKGLAEHIARANPTAVRTEGSAGTSLLDQPFAGDKTMTVEQKIQTLIGKLGENIAVARFVRLGTGDNGSGRGGYVASYIHQGAQLGVLVEVDAPSQEAARSQEFETVVKDLAMQVAAADPQYIRREEVPGHVLDKEKEIARDRARQEGKPEKILDKIVEGRLSKYYEEVCLLEQPFIREPSVTVNQLVAKAGCEMTVARFVRMKVGDTVAQGTQETAPAE